MGCGMFRQYVRRELKWSVLYAHVIAFRSTRPPVARAKCRGRKDVSFLAESHVTNASHATLLIGSASGDDTVCKLVTKSAV